MNAKTTPLEQEQIIKLLLQLSMSSFKKRVVLLLFSNLPQFVCMVSTPFVFVSFTIEANIDILERRAIRQ